MAREIKYHEVPTDLAALERELASPSGRSVESSAPEGDDYDSDVDESRYSDRW